MPIPLTQGPTRPRSLGQFHPLEKLADLHRLDPRGPAPPRPAADLQCLGPPTSPCGWSVSAVRAALGASLIHLAARPRRNCAAFVCSTRSGTATHLRLGFRWLRGGLCPGLTTRVESRRCELQVLLFVARVHPLHPPLPRPTTPRISGPVGRSSETEQPCGGKWPPLPGAIVPSVDEGMGIGAALACAEAPKIAAVIATTPTINLWTIFVLMRTRRRTQSPSATAATVSTRPEPQATLISDYRCSGHAAHLCQNTLKNRRSFKRT